MFKKILYFLFLMLFGLNIVFASNNFSTLMMNSDLNNTFKNSIFKLKIRPLNPQIGDLINIEVESTSLDLNQWMVSYYIDNDLKFSGLGEKYFSFRLSKNKTQLKVVLENEDGEKFQKIKDFNIENIDLVYELEDELVPRYYKGKAVPLSGSKIKFVAFPDFYNDNGKYINPETLVYNWYLNGKLQKYKSGIGKNKFELKKIDNWPLTTRVRVVVADVEGKKKGSKMLVINPKPRPDLLFYYSKISEPFSFKRVIKIRNAYLDDYDLDFYAYPYFVNKTDIKNIVWKIDGIRVYLLKNKNPFLMKISRSEDNIMKEHKVEFEYNIPDKFMQIVSNYFYLLPGEQHIKEYLNQQDLQEQNDQGFNPEEFFDL